MFDVYSLFDVRIDWKWFLFFSFPEYIFNIDQESDRTLVHVQQANKNKLNMWNESFIRLLFRPEDLGPTKEKEANSQISTSKFQTVETKFGKMKFYYIEIAGSASFSKQRSPRARTFVVRFLPAIEIVQVFKFSLLNLTVWCRVIWFVMRCWHRRSRQCLRPCGWTIDHSCHSMPVALRSGALRLRMLRRHYRRMLGKFAGRRPICNCRSSCSNRSECLAHHSWAPAVMWRAVVTCIGWQLIC